MKASTSIWLLFPTIISFVAAAPSKGKL